MLFLSKGESSTPLTLHFKQKGKNMEPDILLKTLRKRATTTKLPEYASEDASGADLYADIDIPVHLTPGDRALIPTGLSISLPAGMEAQIRPRSGLALKHGITVLNAPGTIDADYRGEIGVLLINTGRESFTVDPGMRIAQMVLAPSFRAKFQDVTSLDSTDRSDGGFGSTGVS